jgi:glycosyltransferase involved in cell wall biosynthesis
LEALDRVRAITREGARRVLGLPEGGFVVAGIGRLVPQKNFQLFLRVAALLAEGNAGVTFVIFGDGPLRGELGREAERLGLGARVRFVPFVEDRATLYRSVDVLLVTSDFEGLPMTVAEAMACGVPVVASRLDGIAELFEHGKHALLVSPGDASRFASHVGAMLADVALRESLAAEAQDLVGKRLDARQTVRAIEEVYLRGGLGGKKCEV